MVRITPADVRAIFDTNINDDALTYHITLANEYLADTVEAHPDAPNEARLTLLERLLAAHFASATDPQAASTQVGDVRIDFEGDSGEGLRETRFGRRAIDLDPTNTLEDSGRSTAIFETFGHDSSDW